MSDNQQSPLRTDTEGQPARLALGVVGVRVGYREGIVEDRRGVVKRYAVFAKILRGLPRIPLEPQVALPYEPLHTHNGSARAAVDARASPKAYAASFETRYLRRSI